MADLNDLLLLCYNKGCGKHFKEEENQDDSCAYHPGDPVFHDALKGWSCCKKRSTDFTDFLNFPGCTRGKHNPVKPEEPVKVQQTPLDIGEVISVQAPKPKPASERPPDTVPSLQLKVKVSNSLRTALQRLKLREETKDENLDPSVSQGDGEVAIGTKCKHNRCDMVYNGPETDFTDCSYHPGVAIFHEGYKFWSCCQCRKSDWNEFMKQEGCRVGKHLWVEEVKENQCRIDWHQTGSNVVITVFAKCILPDECVVECNPTIVHITCSYEGGKKKYDKQWILSGVVQPQKSSVEIMESKAEIKLRKADALGWKHLELK